MQYKNPNFVLSGTLVFFRVETKVFELYGVDSCRRVTSPQSVKMIFQFCVLFCLLQFWMDYLSSIHLVFGSLHGYFCCIALAWKVSLLCVALLIAVLVERLAEIRLVFCLTEAAYEYRHLDMLLHSPLHFAIKISAIISFRLKISSSKFSIVFFKKNTYSIL